MMRSLGCTLIQYNWCPYKKRKKLDADTQGEGHVMTEAKIGGMQLQGQEHQGLSATTRSQEKRERTVLRGMALLAP